MATDKIMRICTTCFGTGKVTTRATTAPDGTPIPGVEIDCARCNGGYKELGYMQILSNLTPTCKIANCIDSGEWGGLSDAQIAGVERILSCGFVDMRDGEWARVSLWGIFGESSLTRAALISLIA